MDKIIVTIIGSSLIIFIYWFFFGKKEEAVWGEDGSLDILVNGGYKPNNIKVKSGTTTKLSFIRKDENSCLEEIVIPEFKIKEYLPLNKKVEINITPQKKGTIRFQCGMNMYHGKIIVE